MVLVTSKEWSAAHGGLRSTDRHRTDPGTCPRPPERFSSVQSAPVERNEPGEPSSPEPEDEKFWTHGTQFGAPATPWWASLNEGGDEEVDDDEDDDDDFLSATAPLPLPPEDRLWRHPSELSGLVEAQAAPEQTPAEAPVRRGFMLATVGAALTGAVLAGAAVWLVAPARQVVTERVIERQLVEQPASIVNASLTGIDVVAIAESVKPSIVRLEVLNTIGTVVGSGSGVIFRDDGHVMTNAHVIEGARAIEVVLSDGQRLVARAIGADELTDVAVVKVEAARPLPAILLGATSTLRVGEPAIAVGSPLRLAGGPTVTVGIVSATGRTLDLPGGGTLYDLVQTDAPISPGSSGGALVDGGGALIGLTTVIAVSDVGAEGLGFATPIEIAYDVATDLVIHGHVDHGFLGVGGDDVRRELATSLGLDGGATITAVGNDTPAEAAGIATGDVIIAVDGVPVLTMGELVVAIRRLDPGDTSAITLIRDGDRITVSTRIVSRPN